ncbi:MAG: isochorismate synthase, partial [Acidimicrobiales bacterium]
MTATRPSPAGLVSRTRPQPDVGDLLDAMGPSGPSSGVMGPSGPGNVWIHNGGGLATSGMAARIAVGTGPNRFARAADEVAELLRAIDVDDPLGLPGTGPLAVGAIPFHDSVPGELIVPALVVGRTPQGRAWVTETGPVEVDAGGVARIGGPPSRFGVAGADHGDGCRLDGRGDREAWGAAVDEVLARIAAGPLAKVVLARQVEVTAERAFDLRRVLDGLRRGDPSSFTYAVGDFVGASPELLVRRRGNRVTSRPMAGTATRGATEADDDLLVAALASSAKEAEEHALVVQAVREALDPLCRELVAGAQPDAVRLATVTHLATTVAGHLIEPAPSALALVGLLHPTPAVAGLPRSEALTAIAELEAFDRGLYAGPVGWVDSRGDGDWAVALRCATL